MNQKQGKSKAGILFLIILVVAVALYYNTKNSVKIKPEEDSVSVTVQMYKEAINFKEQLGENTPYPEFFLYTEMLKSKKNYTDEEAADAAMDKYTESEAFMWYGEKNGLEPSDEETDQHLNKLAAKQKKSEDYKEIEAKCKEKDMTVDDIFKKNSRYYSYELYISKVYDNWQTNYDKAHKDENSIVSVYNMEWKDYVKKVIGDYKKTDEYKAREKALKNCKRAYLDNSTIKEMKKSDIFF